MMYSVAQDSGEEAAALHAKQRRNVNKAAVAPPSVSLIQNNHSAVTQLKILFETAKLSLTDLHNHD